MCLDSVGLLCIYLLIMVGRWDLLGWGLFGWIVYGKFIFILGVYLDWFDRGWSVLGIDVDLLLVKFGLSYCMIYELVED